MIIYKYYNKLRNKYFSIKCVEIILSIIILILICIGIVYIGSKGYMLIPMGLLSKTLSDFLLINTAKIYLFFIGTTYISFLFLENRKWVKAILFFSFAIIWVIFYNSIFDFIGSLGTDSFLEAKNFDTDEALFWIKSFIWQLKPEFSIYRFLIYLILTMGSLILSNLILKKTRLASNNYLYIEFLIASTCIFVSLQLSLSGAFHLYFKKYGITLQNFDNQIPLLKNNKRSLNLIVYIGEATSIMNMNVYGYPRNTTPHLTKLSKEDPNLIIFHNVFSTHTHTSPSLLEALSFAKKKEESFLPIHQRRRVSLIDILISGGVDSYLYSNQGKSGTWNQASTVIFRKALKKFSIYNRALGNRDSIPWDHEFYNEYLGRDVFNKLKDRHAIIFFHSYAGHGPYLKNIPEKYRNPVDNYLVNKRPESVVGPNAFLLDGVAAYDKAIKYIDFSVANAINSAKHNKSPLVLIYFSDHGDAVYPGRGHDSSNFVHEMIRVPFLIYFNEAAKKLYNNLYSKYLELAAKQNISTLAQLPSTILDILGVEIQSTDEAMLIQTSLIGENTVHAPILVRETIDGITYINLNNKPFKKKIINGKKLIDKTDNITNIYLALADNQGRKPFICYHRSNTLGKSFRARLVSNCIESDIVIDENKKIHVYRPPAINYELQFHDLNLITRNNKHGLWIDGKNLQMNNNCTLLLSYLKENPRISNTTLAEFPSKSYLYKVKLNGCAAGLQDIGVATSYYVPTGTAIGCSKFIKKYNTVTGSAECTKLNKDLILAEKSNIFTDISFDYSAISALESLEIAHKFKWNTWNVTSDQLSSINSHKFRMVILSNNDPNTL